MHTHCTLEWLGFLLLPDALLRSSAIIAARGVPKADENSRFFLSSATVDDPPSGLDSRHVSYEVDFGFAACSTVIKDRVGN